jgi:outer membrane lipoprotein SlyB
MLPGYVREENLMKIHTRRQLVVGLCCILVLVSFVSCATVEETYRENPKTVVGAAAGAAGGALLGGLIFKSAGAAVIGGLVGGLAGGLIGNAMESQAEERATTVQDYGYTPSQGTLLRIEKVEVEPTSVQPGESVNLLTQYALLTPTPHQPLTVTERWDIRRGQELTGNPVLTIQREDGTWASAIPVTLPTSAKTGTYRVVVTVEGGGSRDSAEATFRVR